jgi:hypothetical protein
MVAAARRGERVYPDPEIERLANLTPSTPEKESEPACTKLPADHVEGNSEN